MKKKGIYKVTVHGWEKHNEKKKKGHQYIFFSTRFFDDAKISSLSSGAKLVYIWLLCRCGDDSKSTISFTEVALKSSLSNLKVVPKLLNQLQELQLVTVHKTPPLITLQDITRQNITEQNNKFTGGKSDPKVVPKLPKINSHLNKQIWSAFKESYELRYKVEPTRNATVNAQISQLAKRLGDEAVEVVKFYLTHNDTYYVSKAHSIGLCLKDAEALRTQWKRGTQITRSKLRQFEKNLDQHELLNAIDRGEV